MKHKQLVTLIERHSKKCRCPCVMPGKTKSFDTMVWYLSILPTSLRATSLDLWQSYCDDTWNVCNMHHITPNSKRWNHSNIPGGDTSKDWRTHPYGCRCPPPEKYTPTPTHYLSKFCVCVSSNVVVPAVHSRPMWHRCPSSSELLSCKWSNK